MEKSVPFEDPKGSQTTEILCGCGSEKVYLGLPLKHLGLYLRKMTSCRVRTRSVSEWSIGGRRICWQERRLGGR
ncbi:unnamed protein product [Prunus armeniaca]|uniref:Uncharacterized protein n=1 Tax=Prunus armeniaca TaxID=36596 RepID=A0A6J5VKC0_PRUAR|nr:unnamed protein product [Prunus armeniaca]